MAKEVDMEQIFEDALTIADRHLTEAMKENEEMAPYIAVAMIEAAVNQAIDVSSPQDIVAILRDLASQIEDECGDEDEDDEDDEDEDEDEDDGKH